jgi:hypothetical protein
MGNMKKHILLFVTALAIVSCTEKKSAFINNDLFFDNLKGNVERVKEVPYAVDSDGKIGSADSCCISLLEYDSKGYRTLDLNQDAAGKVMNGQVYTKRYENGKVKEIQFMVNGKVVSTLSGSLNKSGNYGNSRVYDSAGKLVSFYTDLEVNQYGKIISMKSFKPDGALQQTIVNNYNRQTWIGGFIKDSSGKEISSTAIKLNENMNPSEVVQTQVINGAPSVTITRYMYDRFDEYGNWIQRREVDEKGNVRKLLKREIHFTRK